MTKPAKSDIEGVKEKLSKLRERELFEDWSEMRPMSEEKFREHFLRTEKKELDEAIEQLQDYNLLWGMIQQLYSAAQFLSDQWWGQALSGKPCSPFKTELLRLHQRSILIVAGFLEELETKRYTPPRISTWERLARRKRSKHQRRLKKQMTVEQFKGHMEDSFGITDGTTVKDIYHKPPAVHRRYKNLAKNRH
jgi:hypothetical protein